MTVLPYATHAPSSDSSLGDHPWSEHGEAKEAKPLAETLLPAVAWKKKLKTKPEAGSDD